MILCFYLILFICTIVEVILSKEILPSTGIAKGSCFLPDKADGGGPSSCYHKNQTNHSGYPVIALNKKYYSEKYCGKKVRLTSNTRSIVAIITDECMGGPCEPFDLTRTLFNQLKSKEGKHYNKCKSNGETTGKENINLKYEILE